MGLFFNFYFSFPQFLSVALHWMFTFNTFAKLPAPGCLLPCKFLWKQEVYLVLNFKKMTLCTTSRVAVHPTTRPMDQIIVTQHLLCKTLILLFTLTVHIFYTVHCYEQYLWFIVLLSCYTVSNNRLQQHLPEFGYWRQNIVYT